jgi:hypothetical protein
MSLSTKTTLTKQNSGSLYKPQEINWGSASLELLIKEFQSIFTFLATAENNKIEYTYGWYSVSA